MGMDDMNMEANRNRYMQLREMEQKSGLSIEERDELSRLRSMFEQ